MLTRTVWNSTVLTDVNSMTFRSHQVQSVHVAQKFKLTLSVEISPKCHHNITADISSCACGHWPMADWPQSSQPGTYCTSLFLILFFIRILYVVSLHLPHTHIHTLRLFWISNIPDVPRLFFFWYGSWFSGCNLTHKLASPQPTIINHPQLCSD